MSKAPDELALSRLLRKDPTLDNRDFSAAVFQILVVVISMALFILLVTGSLNS